MTGMASSKYSETLIALTVYSSCETLSDNQIHTYKTEIETVEQLQFG